ncbi:CUS1 [Mytilus edulis]|uniref:SF3B2 n=1 Tax=Mytilus edulis TaxID=6550 RepID=A0A8S3S5Q1_MYTED|nr:CUS1 [Mytilus edulis]
MQQQLPPKPKETTTEETVNVEYVQEQLELDPSDPNYYTFAKIFEAFKFLAQHSFVQENFITKNIAVKYRKLKSQKKSFRRKRKKQKETEEVKPRGMFEEEDDEDDERMETDEMTHLELPLTAISTPQKDEHFPFPNSVIGRSFCELKNLQSKPSKCPIITNDFKKDDLELDIL